MADDTLSTLRRRVAKAPEAPGIYKWKNKDGDVLYVGKAKNLRSRLKSYVNKGASKGLGPWKISLLHQIADVDVTITNSEVEALVLETNLIKQLRPKYNVLMKDDKNYVYVEVTVNEPYPTVDVVRQMQNSKAKYFGPYISAYDTRRALDTLNEIFSFRACSQSIDALNRAKGNQARKGRVAAHGPLYAEAVYGTGKLRPCLDFQIGQCCGTCAGTISQDEYRSRIDQVIHFFKGDYKPVLERGREMMKEAATQKKFERAGKLRDMLLGIEHMQERQIVSDTSGENVDVIGLALLSGKVQVMIMNKRGGKLIGEQQFNLAGSAESIADVLEQFLPQYYESVVDIPEIVLIGEDFPGRETFEEYLSQRKERKVTVRVPERGSKSQLLELAEKNAQEKAKQAEASWEADQRNTFNALEELATLLSLPKAPERIEGYDISHTAGTETVGSMVVTVNGKPRNEHYRSFTIHTMRSGVVDDYRALKEVLTRRLRHLAGGLSFEQEQWEKAGVTIARVKKDEWPALKTILERQTGYPVWNDEQYKEFTVARGDGDILAFVRLHEWDAGSLQLSSLWAEDSQQGSRLAPYLIRSVLRTLKKGKVYSCVPAEREQEYGFVGFRHVLKAPKIMQDHLEECLKSGDHLVMVYDTTQHKPDISLSTRPDLLVIDGGKGQLSAVVEVLKHYGLDIPVIGLAKREEEIFVPGNPVSLLVPKDSPAKFLLMRLRDEAHRFANRHRQKRAAKTAITSQLDRITGIGPETKQKLLMAFGSVDEIRRQPDEKLADILSEEQIAQLRLVL